MFNKFVASILPCFPKKFIWIFSKPYISGETIEDVMNASRSLNNSNIKVTIDVLGEFIKTLDDAMTNKQEYLDLIDITQTNKIDGNFSLKPTSFGLLIDKNICYSHIREIVVKATSYDSFVRIDMEDSLCTDDTIELFRKLKTDFPSNVGLVLQAYLRRTFGDLEGMSELNSSNNPLNFRLCKGIYVEPEEIAYKKSGEINQSFLEDLEFILKNRMYAAIATHDKILVEGAYKLIKKYNVPKNMYEFQMLYGVTPGLRESILNEGHIMRVYVPFGRQWHGYSIRRLKENPKIATHIIKALFYKG